MMAHALGLEARLPQLNLSLGLGQSLPHVLILQLLELTDEFWMCVFLVVHQVLLSAIDVATVYTEKVRTGRSPFVN